MRTIGVVTVGRSDYGIYRPILKAIQKDPALELRLMVSGTHLSPEFGTTATLIEADGFIIGDRIEMLLSSDSAEGVAKSIALGVAGFAQAFARSAPDVLVVLGDRFEMYAAALAALPFLIPVAHVHGGEITHGAMDDALRHSLTKLSHLHFVSTEAYGQRVRQLGEDPARIVVSGAPALDNLAAVPLMTPAELTACFGFATSPAPLVVTFHPVTLEPDGGDSQMAALLSALDRAALPVVFTQPNNDAGGRRLGAMVSAFVVSHPNAHEVGTLGVQGYFSLMACAAAMVGNSSSGIIEAPSLGLPVVNIGTRQSGRVRAANVIDVEPDAEAIYAAIQQATAPGFQEHLRGADNPYGRGTAAGVIVERLKREPLRELIAKRFVDTDGVGA